MFLHRQVRTIQHRPGRQCLLSTAARTWKDKACGRSFLPDLRELSTARLALSMHSQEAVPLYLHRHYLVTSRHELTEVEDVHSWSFQLLQTALCVIAEITNKCSHFSQFRIHRSAECYRDLQIQQCGLNHIGLYHKETVHSDCRATLCYGGICCGLCPKSAGRVLECNIT